MVSMILFYFSTSLFEMISEII